MSVRGNDVVTITLTPEQVRAAAHEVGESGILLDDSLFSVDVYTPRAIAQARAAIDEIERKMAALHWGHAVEPIEVTASPEWLSELAAGMLYELSCAPDTGLARVSGEDLRGAVDCMRDVGVQAGAVIVEQLTAKDALADVAPAKACRGRAPHNRIQWFRESKGMSRRDVALVVDTRGNVFKEDDVERWEAGERPNESHLGVLARFFGVSAVYLAGEEEDKP